MGECKEKYEFNYDFYDGPEDKKSKKVTTNELGKQFQEAIMEEKIDNVNHPSHYEKSCSLECIDVMIFALGYEKVIDFCLCNAFKYLWRFKNKNGEEDIQKAKWYIDKSEKLIDELQKSDFAESEEIGSIGSLWVQYDRIDRLYSHYESKLG